MRNKTLNAGPGVLEINRSNESQLDRMKGWTSCLNMDKLSLVTSHTDHNGGPCPTTKQYDRQKQLRDHPEEAP